jgi:glycosyltransferase involved in cell wall biosynthesis
MPIIESDVSIIIPTYNNAALAERALISVLGTNAGEIIICDDNSTDETLEVTRRYDDERIKIIKNDTNIGLWENHLVGLRASTKKWIKFLQQDDIIEENGLKILCDNADENTAIVAALPVGMDLDTGKKEIPQILKSPRHWSSKEYLNRILKVGYELGNPSMTLIRKEFIDLDQKAWASDISADYILHVTVPTKGDVVIVPAGPLTMCSHKAQDSQTVDFAKTILRMSNTLKYLSGYPNEMIKKHVRIISYVESFGFLRYMFGQLRRGKKLEKQVFRYWFTIINNIKLITVLTDFNNIVYCFRTKYFGLTKNLDRYKNGM